MDFSQTCTKNILRRIAFGADPVGVRVANSYRPSPFGYRKFPRYSDTQKICCNHFKIWTMWLYHRVMSPNDADGMANSVDPDQNGSALLALTYLSKNLGSLWYFFAKSLFSEENFYTEYYFSSSVCGQSLIMIPYLRVLKSFYAIIHSGNFWVYC